MEFGVFVNGYIPGPAAHMTELEHKELFREAEFVVFADKHNWKYAWFGEHHALTEYSHLSAPEVVMGWVAAQGTITAAGWSLFALQFFWQLPHFLAIAWLYREDYARAGFRMLPIVDPDGRHTALQAVSHTLGLLTVSLAPFVWRVTGPVYLAGALLLGSAFLWLAVRFARRLDRASARALFLGSIVYLPVLLGLMVWDKTG